MSERFVTKNRGLHSYSDFLSIPLPSNRSDDEPGFFISYDLASACQGTSLAPCGSRQADNPPEWRLSAYNQVVTLVGLSDRKNAE